MKRAKARTLDLLVASAVLLVAAFMVSRSIVRGTSFIFPNAATASAVFLASAAALAAALWYLSRISRRGVRILARTTHYFISATYVALAGGRVLKGNEDFMRWPPAAIDTTGTPFAHLDREWKTEWALRLVTHYLASAPDSARRHMRLPAAWPFPDDVKVAVLVSADTVAAWTRADGSPYTCVTVIAGALAGLPPMSEDGRACSTTIQPHGGATFAALARSTTPDTVAAFTVDAPTNGWTQYRGDAGKSGTIAGIDSAKSWSAHVDGQVRSSASAAAGVVLVGAHGTGALAAFDQASGRNLWRARVPNWIHQDAVSDGRIVVVGFGENYHEIPLKTPAGVAAYDLHTGASLWTAFDESSVMTSPVIRGGDVVYVSEGGIVRKRDLRTGRLIADLSLPGSAIMGPPAASGDRLVAALENDTVCLVLMSTMTRAWCRTIPDMRMMGHSAPAIGGQRIVVSGHVPIFRSWRVQLTDVPASATARLLWNMASGRTVIGGQAFRALDMRDGHELWRSRIYAARKLSSGHTSGTATMTGDAGVIVLPLADTIVAFDAATGNTRWTAPAHGSRGAPLVIGDQVVNAGADGFVELRALATGALTCAARFRTGFDRSGPALVGSSVIFVDLAGAIYSFPRDDVLRCAIATPPPSPRPAPPARDSTARAR